MNKQSIINVSQDSCLINYGFKKTKKKYMTKIFFEYKKKEIEISNLIRKIKEYHLYFLPLISETQFNIQKLTQEWHYINIIKMEYKINVPKSQCYKAFHVNSGGENFKKLLLSKKLTWLDTGFILKILSRLLEITNILHNNKIAHLDIRPENIMYDETVDNFSDRIKLTNFGNSDMYPFNRYRYLKILNKNPYFPISSNENYIKYLPKKKPNDWIINNHIYYHNSDSNSFDNVYKHDVYSIGMSIYFIFNCINKTSLDDLLKNTTNKNKEKKKLILLHTILQKMTHEDINERPSISLIQQHLSLKNTCCNIL